MKLLISYAVNAPVLEIRDTVITIQGPLNAAMVSFIRDDLAALNATPCAIIAITKLES